MEKDFDELHTQFNCESGLWERRALALGSAVPVCSFWFCHLLAV